MRFLFSPLCGWAHHRIRSKELQGYLTYKNPPPPRTLPQAYASGFRGVLGGWVFLMSEVPLYPHSGRVGTHVSADTRLAAPFSQSAPWRQPRGKSMVYVVNSHTNATSKRWRLWEIDL